MQKNKKTFLIKYWQEAVVLIAVYVIFLNFSLPSGYQRTFENKVLVDRNQRNLLNLRDSRFDYSGYYTTTKGELIFWAFISPLKYVLVILGAMLLTRKYLSFKSLENIKTEDDKEIKTDEVKVDDKVKKEFYKFENKNEEDKNYVAFEVWENKHPEKIFASQVLEFRPDNISKERVPELMSLWNKLSQKLSDPILTIQCDIGKGAEKGYRYRDSRDEIPPNAVGYTTKPIFDKSIEPVRFSWQSNKSIVYTSSLSSPTLKEELEKLEELFIRFFKNSEEVSKIFGRKANIFETAIMIDNEILRKMG